MHDLTTIQLMNQASGTSYANERTAIDAASVSMASEVIKAISEGFQETFIECLDFMADAPKGPVIG